MKKLFFLWSLLLLTILSACGVRERILATPDYYTVPDDSLVANCTKDEDVYTFVYKDDGVYLYYINDEEQSDAAVDNILQLAYSHGNSVENYLDDEFPDSCIITDYVGEE